MTTNGPDERSGRESRLLVLIILVAVAVLLVLARFRFPAGELETVTSTPGPIARIAARASFDDLAAAMRELIDRVAPAVVLVQLERAPGSGRGRDSVQEQGMPAGTSLRLAPGIRLRPGVALVHVPAGMAISEDQELTDGVEVMAVDLSRQMALLGVPPQGGTGSLPIPVDSFAGFSFVGVVEGTTSGPTARPVFVGRTDVSSDIRWESSVLSVGGSTDVAAGSLLFALDGRFVGMALRDGGGLVIVPVAALNTLLANLLGTGGDPSR